MTYDADFVEGFWRRVDHRGSCGLWTGGTRAGFPIYRGRIATRVCYELTFGRVPRGRRVRRRCANKLCVSPDHLTADPREHVKRPSKKLSRLMADDIRARHANGETVTELAERYSVTVQHAHGVINGRVWNGDGKRKPKPGSVAIVRVETDQDGVEWDVLACGHDRMRSTPWPNQWRVCRECEGSS